MILFINARIADEPAPESQSRNPRGLLPADDRADVFKYALASVAVIPFSHVCIYYDLAANYAHRRADIDSHIAQLFPQAVVHHYRNELQEQWEEAMRTVFAIDGDELVWYCCYEDQVFIDYDLRLIQGIQTRLLELAEQHRYVSCYLSNWPEAMPFTCSAPNDARFPVLLGEASELGRIVTWSRPDGVQIVNRNLLRQWWFAQDYGEAPIPQIDDPNWLTSLIRTVDNIHCLIPARELVRHYDGYLHSHNLGVNICPPLSIPDGFFTGEIRILYGAERRQPGAVHINPLIADYAAASPDGADLRCTLADLPLFWRDRIAEISDVCTAEVRQQNRQRDAAMLQVALAACKQMPAGLMRNLRAALRTTDPQELLDLFHEALDYVNTIMRIADAAQGYDIVAYRQWHIALSYVHKRAGVAELIAMAAGLFPESNDWFAGNSVKECADFIDAHFMLSCLDSLERADAHGALRLTLPEYLQQPTTDADVMVEPFGLSPLDTWIYLRLLAHSIRFPDEKVTYSEISRGLDAVSERLQATIDGELPCWAQRLIRSRNAPFAEFGPKAKSGFEDLANPVGGNLAHQFAYETAQVEYTQLLSALTPSTSIALNQTQLMLSTHGAEAAEASLLRALPGSLDSPFDYVAVCCCLAALRLVCRLFGADNVAIPLVQRCFSLLRDMNCRRMALPEVQRMIVEAVVGEEGVERALAYNRFGEALFALDLEQGAEAAFQQATAEAPDTAVVYSNLAVLCWNRGQQEQARAYLEMALQIEPDNHCAVANLRAMQAA